MFPGCTVPSDSKETEIRSSDQEASPSVGKNTRIGCHAWVCVPTISGDVNISEVPGCHFLRKMSS